MSKDRIDPAQDLTCVTSGRDSLDVLAARLAPEERAALQPVGGHVVQVGARYQLKSRFPKDIDGIGVTVRVVDVNPFTAIVKYETLGAHMGVSLTCFGDKGSGALYELLDTAPPSISTPTATQETTNAPQDD